MPLTDEASRDDNGAVCTRGWPYRSSMTTYRRDQWISSFEGQLSILRPHLTGRVLGAISATAWQAYGAKGLDPIQSAQDESAAIAQRLSPQRPAPGTRRS